MLIGYTMSNHLCNDREDRLTRIAMTIGFGEVVKETYHKDGTSLLTDTGVMYIVDKPSRYIITVYVATVKEVVAMFDGRPPSYLVSKARKNERKFWG